MTEISLFALSPYLCLLAAVIFSLIGRKETLVFVLLGVALVFAFFTKTVTGLGFLAFLTLPVFLFIWVNHHFAEILRKISFLIFLVLTYLLGTHQMPGVENLKIFDQLVFADGTAAFNMFFNFDKVFLGVVIFAMLPRLERQVPLRSSYFTILKYLVAATVVLLPLAYFSGYIQFQLNTNPYLILWAVNNLFFVCFAEEVIFRRFIQNNLSTYFRNTQYGDLVSIFVAALIFGVAHFSGGFIYMGLAAVAGIFYGLCFYHTCNVRSSMMLHFLVNLGHALLFTYPYAV